MGEMGLSKIMRTFVVQVSEWICHAVSHCHEKWAGAHEVCRARNILQWAQSLVNFYIKMSPRLTLNIQGTAHSFRLRVQFCVLTIMCVVCTGKYCCYNLHSQFVC